jgi:hypothetical protein
VLIYYALSGLGSSCNQYIRVGNLLITNEKMCANDSLEKRREKFTSNIFQNLFNDITLYGAYIALENGLDLIINKCPRFKNWLDILEAKVKE